MRFKLTLSPTNEIVPFTYYNDIKSYFHRVLGDNEYHDSLSLYSLSNIHHPKCNNVGKKGLKFTYGAYFYVSIFDENIIKLFLSKIYDNLTLFNGLTIQKVELVKPLLNKIGENTYLFKVKSPILLKETNKKSVGNKNIYYDYNNPYSTVILTRILKKKLTKANIPFNDDKVKLKFDSTYYKAKTNSVCLNNLHHKVTWCPVILETDDENIANCLYDLGVGNSTGCGLGFVF